MLLKILLLLRKNNANLCFMFLPDHFLSQQHFCWDPPHKQRTSVLLLDLFLATPISSARASLQLPNTGIDPKLTEINRKHFCELQWNSGQTCASERLFYFSCLPKMKQVTVSSSSDSSPGDLSLLLEAHILCWLIHLPGKKWFCQICYTCSVCFLTSLCVYRK